MSAILSADDLNDFISPGVACIKPVETLPKKEESNSDNPYEVTKEDKIQPENLPPAQISLTDCLACSGCVTSAEAVLISLQSHAEVLNTLDTYPELSLSGDDNHSDEGRIFVASVSPQVRASLAATYGIAEKDADNMIHQFLSGPQGLRAGGAKNSGFSWVVDTNVMREAVLSLTADEVSDSLAAASSAGSSLPKRPILSSACPGWICYAEKTHPFILPHLSRLKSPQALTGTFLKTVLSKSLGIPTSRIWHLAIMPCFDKKLEASREELTDAAWSPVTSESTTPIRDVDCVITTRELLSLASSRGISLPSLPLTPFSQPQFPDPVLNDFLFSKRHLMQNVTTGTSGGYLYHVLQHFQSRNPGSQIEIQRGRNADVVEYFLMSPEHQPIMKAARYYGFRNIQNLVRKLKPARVSRLPGAKTANGAVGGTRRQPMARNAVSGGSGSDYAYVEVMACPGGCTNGGGQIRIEDAREATSSTQTEALEAASKPSPHEQRAWLARVDEAYFSAESDSESEVNPQPQPRSLAEQEARVHNAMSHWSTFMGVPLSKLVYTTYREVESDVGKPQGPPDATRVVELAGKIGGGW
ncbi:iron-sulfur cluster assembly protein NAR1 [Aspergillus saccharolyticus JOP 1030-1]|uniref:Cytosolic Fe-S cluster assembly factor NAR1 n=1 Tax=Aspergillus saccharolyticus JOP 1030-1 TaxID=1450539 RepID=A0A318ZNC7_9EURO|nr:nuclear architecture related protein [Aspergillus saccharolyticus JOP 1030-1]PYH45933.1 nuclear architecture related protein [Aspergillus saccharolyticus JOP 1030-1]